MGIQVTETCILEILSFFSNTTSTSIGDGVFSGLRVLHDVVLLNGLMDSHLTYEATGKRVMVFAYAYSGRIFFF